MDLRKQQKFQELKKKYGFDIAVFKQSPDNKGLSDEDLYKSLLLFHVQNILTDEINEYCDAVEFSSQEMGTLIAMLFNTSGEIIGQIARHDPEFVVNCREIAISQFDSHLEFLNGSESKEP